MSNQGGVLRLTSVVFPIGRSFYRERALADPRQRSGNILSTDKRTYVRYNEAVRRSYDWVAIKAYYDAGHGHVACRQKFGFTHGAWNKAIRRGVLLATPTLFRDRRRLYDWRAVQAYYDEGHTYRECREKFGFCAESWTRAVNRGELKARARRMPLEMLLTKSNSHKAVKSRLLEAGLLQNVCQACGLREWLGRPLTMHIDHINGKCNDHRLENLRMLCPNCHSQTPTYGGRNAKRPERLQDTGGAV